MKVVGNLAAAVSGPGLIIRPGIIKGELDGAVVWVQGPETKGRRIGVPTVRFKYVEPEGLAPERTLPELEQEARIKASRRGTDPEAAVAELHARLRKEKQAKQLADARAARGKEAA